MELIFFLAPFVVLGVGVLFVAFSAGPAARVRPTSPAGAAASGSRWCSSTSRSGSRSPCS